MSDAPAFVCAETGASQPARPGDSARQGQEEDGFAGVLAKLNPLQYVPVVGMIYRAITGDRPESAWRLGGAAVAGALMGGPVGVIPSLSGVGLEELFNRAVHAAGTVGAPGEAPVPQPAARAIALAAYERT